LERAYVPLSRRDKHPRSIKRKAYAIIRQITTAGGSTPIVRVITFQPAIEWSAVWRNLNRVWVVESVKSAWFGVVLDLIATNERLHRNQSSESDACELCENVDTLRHRLMACVEGEDIGMDAYQDVMVPTPGTLLDTHFPAMAASLVTTARQAHLLLAHVTRDQ
jgi:hypothetical protein